MMAEKEIREALELAEARVESVVEAGVNDLIRDLAQTALDLLHGERKCAAPGCEESAKRYCDDHE